jgi:formate dehydrogenase major subunit
MQVTRRQFFKICGAGLGASSVAYLGFSPEPALAEVRAFKLASTRESRSICPYCSVSCGVLIHTMGSGAKNAHSSIVHIEGDPDNPVNRGTLCPKGAGLLDMINSRSRGMRLSRRSRGS